MAALQNLHDCYAPAVRRLVAKLIASDADREDCEQEAWRGVCKGLLRFGNLVEQGRFRDWIAQVVRYTARAFKRRRRRQESRDRLAAEVRGPVMGPCQTSSEFDLDAVASAWPETPYLTGRDDTDSLLRRALTSQPPGVAVTGYCVLRLRCLENYSVSETAAKLGLTPRQVVIHHSRAIKRLREYFAERAGDEP